MNNAVIHFEEINEARDIGELLAPLLPLFDEELGVEIILRNCTAQINADEEKNAEEHSVHRRPSPSTTTSSHRSPNRVPLLSSYVQWRR